MSRLSLALPILLSWMCIPGTAGAATPTAKELMIAAGFSAKQQKAVFAGDVVGVDLERVKANEVVSLVALRIPMSLDEVFTHYARGQDYSLSPHFLGMGQIDRVSPARSLDGAHFTASDTDEVGMLLAAEPGVDLNLSTAEIGELRALAAVSDERRIERVSEVYRGFLARRAQAYLKDGLGGIAPYARRNGKSTSPGEEIRRVWEADLYVRELFPTFFHAIESFPKDQPAEMHHAIFWVKQQFESKWSSRPAFMLEHVAWQRGDEHVLISNRQFFVGHSYNANQGITLVLPHEDEVILFHHMDVTSDLATQYVTWIALPIAQKIMREQLQLQFRLLRDAESEAD